MRRACLAVAAIAALPRAATAGPDEASIVGGAPAQVGQFPTVVAVEIDGVGACTGTLIHPRFVVTAAHCVQPASLGLATQAQVTAAIDVRLDAVVAFTGGGRVIAAARTLYMPGFSVEALGNDDIGIVELATPVTDRPVARLNRDALAAPVGVVVTQVGFGLDGEGGIGRAMVLADRPSTSCAAIGFSDANLLCFDRGLCNGDSGGPAFATIDGVQTLVGVATFADLDCAQLGAETRVDAEVAYLDEQIGPGLACVRDGACATGCPADERDIDCPACADGCIVGEVCDESGSCVPDDDGGGGDGDGGPAAGGCDAGRGGGPMMIAVLAAIAFATRRRRSQRRRAGRAAMATAIAHAAATATAHR